MTRVPGTFKERVGQLREIRVPDEVAILNPEAVGLRCFRLGECAIMLAQEPDDRERLHWHLSISHPRRYPTWDEIKTARYRLTPENVTMAMLLPPVGEYVNVREQDNVFHLWEIEAP
jgi:hypothetical protein